MTGTETDTPPLADHTEVDEVGEFIATLLATPAHRLTACRGWTAHELVAHLTAGAAEEADLIEAHFSGETRPTRGFEARELPYRSRPDTELRDRLVSEAARLTVALEKLSGRDNEAVLFTGREMTADDFAMHSRSECSLHRWDLVGRDDVGWAMLSQPSLATHALGVLSSMSALPETPANRLKVRASGPEVQVIIRSAPHDDIVVSTTGAVTTLAAQAIGDAAPDVELDPAARLLLLWGRREPSAPMDVHATGPARDVLETLFGW